MTQEELVPFTPIGEEVNGASAKKIAGKPLCEQCGKAPSRYTCPLCSLRSCSLECSKQHKMDKECSGLPASSVPEWKCIENGEQYGKEHFDKDQSFLALVERRMQANRPAAKVSEKTAADLPQNDVRPSSARRSSVGSAGSAVELMTAIPRVQLSLTKEERALIEAARHRLIYLTLPEGGAAGGSYYELYSDTIFWTIKLTWVGVQPPEQQESADEAEGSPTNAANSNDSYIVQRIPESLSLRGLLKQFLQPRTDGYVVKTAQLDAEKMAPFRAADSHSLVVYMEATGKKEGHYYPELKLDETILKNLRHKRVTSHPSLVVALREQVRPDQFPVVEEEAKMKRAPANMNRSLLRESPHRQQHSGGGGPLHHRPQRFSGPSQRMQPYQQAQQRWHPRGGVGGAGRGAANTNRGSFHQHQRPYLGSSHNGWNRNDTSHHHPTNTAYSIHPRVGVRGAAMNAGHHPPRWPAPHQQRYHHQSHHFQGQRQGWQPHPPRHHYGGPPKGEDWECEPDSDYERFVDRDPADIALEEYAPTSNAPNDQGHGGGKQSSDGLTDGSKVDVQTGATGSHNPQKSNEGKTQKKNYLDILGGEFGSP